MSVCFTFNTLNEGSFAGYAFINTLLELIFSAQCVIASLIPLVQPQQDPQLKDFDDGFLIFIANVLNLCSMAAKEIDTGKAVEMILNSKSDHLIKAFAINHNSFPSNSLKSVRLKRYLFSLYSEPYSRHE